MNSFMSDEVGSLWNSSLDFATPQVKRVIKGKGFQIKEISKFILRTCVKAIPQVSNWHR
jgi:hypothetical protein